MSDIDKKRPEQHRIDDKGVDLFRSAMPQTAKESWVFSTEEKDYGIDGQIQITQKEKHTGEFYKVQIKSKKNPDYSKDGSFISVQIDLKSAYFLIENIKSPTALIVIDVSKKVIYWHPIQTDEASRNALQSSLDQETITIRVNTDNKFSKRNYQSFHQYLKEAQVRIAQKSLLSAETTYNEGTKFLAELEEKVLHVPGFEAVFRKNSELTTPGTVFSVGYDKQKSVDYIPGADFTPELLPKINLTANFSLKTKEGREKADALKKLVDSGKGNVVLTDENIADLKILSGNSVIDDKRMAVGGISISLSPSVPKKRQQIYISGSSDEIVNTVDSWFDDGKIHLESIPGQVFDIELAVAIKPGVKSKFRFRMNEELITSPAQHLRYMDFFKDSSELLFRVSDGDGFINKTFSGSIVPQEIVSDSMYEMVKVLSEIESVSKVKINYPLPKKITNNDLIYNKFILRLLQERNITDNISVKMQLKSGAEKDILGKELDFTYTPPALYIFGEPFILPGLKQYVIGKVSSIEPLKSEEEGTFVVKFKDAKISLIKIENN